MSNERPIRTKASRSITWPMLLVIAAVLFVVAGSCIYRGWSEDRPLLLLGGIALGIAIGVVAANSMHFNAAAYGSLGVASGLLVLDGFVNDGWIAVFELMALLMFAFAMTLMFAGERNRLRMWLLRRRLAVTAALVMLAMGVLGGIAFAELEVGERGSADASRHIHRAMLWLLIALVAWLAACASANSRSEPVSHHASD